MEKKEDMKIRKIKRMMQKIKMILDQKQTTLAISMNISWDLKAI